jgi:hypothetical protein
MDRLVTLFQVRPATTVTRKTRQVRRHGAESIVLRPTAVTMITIEDQTTQPISGQAWVMSRLFNKTVILEPCNAFRQHLEIRRVDMEAIRITTDSRSPVGIRIGR